ncbi:hypothetical protein EN875_032015 [Mesorhizobium sp. M2D.F.Ca.ET.232.01.1.1]|uniref:hypothetical protein n=1 Tax=Mesorhizobium sp. M2D.F.Ca.ET.232.01.1.1 TaxID=2496670 RepID=UPI000FCC0758|nr:hypothetical protein [Mesorhizobium sp. M2D.F.Ca.ET.232.01.1.1]TGP28186.1 hypothetical protein EN875_032015 [Mesorhizobium sp. M2D.F.Ca.ET.232.01.1.1]
MSAYSKLISAVVGNLVAILAVYLASKGLAVCTTAADGSDACTMMGFTTAQVTAAAMVAVNAAFVWASPANKPKA